MADVSSGGSERPSGKAPKGSGSREGQPTRRTFTDAYKLRIVGEYDALTEHGARGALLRREGLYDSHVAKWRRARDRSALGAKSSPGPAQAAGSAENRRLKAENARLAAELAKTRAVLEIMGKVSALLEGLSERADRE
ncbi:transposase [Frankia sp. Cas8]|uniref:transposase n=1 Tax=unclassified Frankia TaxID=2632575 RepID=UPI003A0FC942